MAARFLPCRPGQRTADDLEIIYEELLHIKALSHLSTTVSAASVTDDDDDDDDDDTYL